MIWLKVPISNARGNAVASAHTPGPLESHCRRVAALALEIAADLKLTPAETATLEKAALHHHFPVEVLDPRAFERLMSDLRGPDWPAIPASQPEHQFPEPEVREVLWALHGRPARGRRAAAGQAAPPPTAGTALLAEIVEVSNLFEERLEFLPFELRTVEQILDELDWMARDGLYRPAVVEAIVKLPRVRMEELLANVRRLPVFPAVALKALELASSERSSMGQIERLMATDQVLAGHIIRLANSSLYSPARRISSIAQAISYVGLEAARRVMTAAVFQPLFASASLRELWKHSVAMAELTERIAVVSRRIAPAEAFLAGLMHDIGRLALQRLPREDGIVFARLLERHCEPVFAEMVLCGFDHGAAGAEILRLWSFPVELVEAVQHHHWPERHNSPLAAALYLAEVASGSGEDTPSWLRLRAVEDRLGVSLEDLGAPQAGLVDFLVA